MYIVTRDYNNGKRGNNNNYRILIDSKNAKVPLLIQILVEKVSFFS